MEMNDKKKRQSMMLYILIGLVVFAVHFLELALLFVICLCPNFVMRVGNAGIKFLSKRGWLKDYEKWYEMVNVQVAEFSDAFKRAAKHLPGMIVTLVVTMAQLACMYMIPWFVLHAFGKDGDFISCLAAGSMVQMVASAVPLPGGTGGAEGGFALFYGPLFGSSASAGYLVWRIVTFFGPTLLAAPMLGLRSTSGTTCATAPASIATTTRPATRAPRIARRWASRGLRFDSYVFARRGRFCVFCQCPGPASSGFAAYQHCFQIATKQTSIESSHYGRP